MDDKTTVAKLYDAVREESNATLWSRAEHLAKTSTVDAKRTHNDELEVKLTTRGGMVSPLVVLSTAQTDWSCDCSGEGPVCVHAATAVIAIRASLNTEDKVPELKVPTAKVGYRLTRLAGNLAIERVLVRAGKETTLKGRLSQAARKIGNEDVAVSQADLAVDVVMGPLAAGRIPRQITTRLLKELKGCTDVTLDGKKVRVGTARPVVSVFVEDHDDGFRVSAEQDPKISEVFGNGAVIRSKELRAIGELDLSARDIEELRKGRIFGFGDSADLSGRILPALKKRVPVDIRSKLLPGAVAMSPRLVMETAFDGEYLTVLPTILYGDPACARVDGGKLQYISGQLPLRNERKEDRLTTMLRESLGMRIGHSEQYHGMGALQIAEQLRSFGHATIEGDGLTACFVTTELTAVFDENFGDLGLGFMSADGETKRTATPEAVIRAWQKNEQLVPLVEGGWAPLPQAVLDRCGHLLMDLLAAKEANHSLPQAAMPDLARLYEALDAPPPPSLDRLRVLAEDFSGLKEVPLPEGVNATLRDYQREGVNWLGFLSEANLGGMLADDMGLGKTLQALCAIKPPALVAAPASVVHNWVSEIERFRPGLTVNIYHGSNRELNDADVTLTTYAILRLDAKALAEREWDTVILDEAQYIKNADSQVAQAAFSLNGRFRLTLSGTPVENRLDELWSQFHFINRGLLGGRRHFQDIYSRPIAEGDPVALKRLRTRIRPFLLRREKRHVAKELPPRTDMIARCNLSEDERTAYEAIKAATRKDVLEQLQAGGSVMAALEALLRLRQAACHTALLPGQEAESSAKIRLLLEMLDSVVAEDHKALVFSQWTSMLDLIEPHLEAANIPYIRLDGSTRDRKGVVETFQSKDGPPVILISLRAGGTGLNLTAADNVFLMDPWWNPAVEDQAADRAHRIGQERPVLVHRLVSENTVEERMLSLQDKKRALANATTGDGAAAFGLTRNDLLALLS